MDNLVQLSSSTQAMRARDFLKSKGIKSAVQRIPASRGIGACSYGLKIYGNINDAVALLRANNFRIIGRAGGF